MSIEDDRLVGRFVTEVGVRQAWPFLTLCDNVATPSDEIRLCIDTAFNVSPARPAIAVDETARWLSALGDVLNLTVDEAAAASVHLRRRQQG